MGIGFLGWTDQQYIAEAWIDVMKVSSQVPCRSIRLSNLFNQVENCIEYLGCPLPIIDDGIAQFWFLRDHLKPTPSQLHRFFDPASCVFVRLD